MRKFHAAPKFNNVSGAGATTAVKTSFGSLIGVTINGVTTAGTITIYDNTAGSGTTIATIASAAVAQGQFYPYPADFNTGLTVVHTNTMNFTVTYR